MSSFCSHCCAGWRGGGCKADAASTFGGSLRYRTSIICRNALARKGKPGVVLVDARPMNEYLGNDEIWLRKGHIPGAISFHWARLMEADNTHKFKPFAQVKAELETAGLTPDKEIIVYCGTSREGSLLRLYLKHVARYPNVRLYEGSWKEYVSLKQFPAETTANKVPWDGTGTLRHPISC